MKIKNPFSVVHYWKFINTLIARTETLLTLKYGTSNYYPISPEELKDFMEEQGVVHNEAQILNAGRSGFRVKKKTYERITKLVVQKFTTSRKIKVLVEDEEDEALALLLDAH